MNSIIDINQAQVGHRTKTNLWGFWKIVQLAISDGPKVVWLKATVDRKLRQHGKVCKPFMPTYILIPAQLQLSKVL